MPDTQEQIAAKRALIKARAERLGNASVRTGTTGEGHVAAPIRKVVMTEGQPIINTEPVDSTPIQSGLADRNMRNTIQEQEKIIITKAQLQEIYREAMMKGAMAGNLSDPQNVEVEKQYTSDGDFDEEGVNQSRKQAEKTGDVSYINKRILARYHQDRAKPKGKGRKVFNPEEIITQWDVESGQHSTRHYGANQ